MSIQLQTFQNQLALITLENRQLQTERDSRERVIQSQEVAIRALQYAATQKPIDAQSLVDSVKAITEKDRERDKVNVFGVVALKRFDGGFFEVDAAEIARKCNLPEIMEGVKRLFGKEEPPS